MLSIGRTIISMDVLEKKFMCDLQNCKGACCFYGDSGAPLEKEEGEILEKILPELQDILRPEGKEAIGLIGSSMIDSDGDLVTPLIGKEECAYTLLEDGIYKCAIEKAWHMGLVSFRKPVSCHLFPVRLKKFEGFDAVNYEEWKICRPARELGQRENMPVYRFLEEPLKRVYGAKWYKEVVIAAREIDKRSGGKTF